jgi:hypothetical protein
MLPVLLLHKEGDPFEQVLSILNTMAPTLLAVVQAAPTNASDRVEAYSEQS